jgi:hypothetical protein
MSAYCAVVVWALGRTVRESACAEPSVPLDIATGAAIIGSALLIRWAAGVISE